MSAICTKDSVTRAIFEIMREVAAPLFTQKGFIDVAAQISAATSLQQLRLAMTHAERVCVLPPRLVAAWEDLRRAMDEVEKEPKGDYAFANVAAFVAANAIVEEAANAPMQTTVMQ